MSSAPAARSASTSGPDPGIERHLGGDRAQRGFVALDQLPLVEDALAAVDLAALELLVDGPATRRARRVREHVHADVDGADGAVEVEEHRRAGEVEPTSRSVDAGHRPTLAVIHRRLAANRPYRRHAGRREGHTMSTERQRQDHPGRLRGVRPRRPARDPRRAHRRRRLGVRRRRRPRCRGGACATARTRSPTSSCSSRGATELRGVHARSS